MNKDRVPVATCMIEQYMHDNKLSMYAAAKRVGVHWKTISCLLGNGYCSHTTAFKLIRVFGSDVCKLDDRRDKPTRDTVPFNPSVIRQYLVQHHRGIQAFIDIAGLSNNTYYRIMHRGVATKRVLCKLACEMGCDVKELILNV